MLDEYNHQISFRADQLPITKVNYIVNPNKEETMKITRGDNPLNLIVHTNFRLKTLGFSEWLEVINYAKKLGLPPPPALATFRMTAEDKKRKRTEILKEVFVTENITVDEMQRNLIPPPGVVLIEGLIINEPESGIFFMNRNTDIAFQRERGDYWANLEPSNHTQDKTAIRCIQVKKDIDQSKSKMLLEDILRPAWEWIQLEYRKIR
ncbi:hypothetical protein Tco_0009228 [Tanacetum coccineum]